MGKCIFMVGAIACGQETVYLSQYCELHQNEGPPESTFTPDRFPAYPDRDEPTDDEDDTSDTAA